MLKQFLFLTTIIKGKKFTEDNGLNYMEISRQKKDSIDYFLSILKTKTNLAIKKYLKQASNNIPSSEIQDGQNSNSQIEPSISDTQIKEQSSNSNPHTPNTLRGRQKTPPKVIEENFKRKQEFQQNQAQGYKNLMQNLNNQQQKNETKPEQTQPIPKQEETANLLQENGSRKSQEEQNLTKQQQQQSQKQEEVVTETPLKQQNLRSNKDTLEENVLVYSFNNNQNQQLGYLSFKKDSKKVNSPNLLNSAKDQKAENLNSSQKQQSDSQQLKQSQTRKQSNSIQEQPKPHIEQTKSLLQQEIQQKGQNQEQNNPNQTQEQKQQTENSQSKGQNTLQISQNQKIQANSQVQQFQEQQKPEEQSKQNEKRISQDYQQKSDQPNISESSIQQEKQQQVQQQNLLVPSVQLEQPKRKESQIKQNQIQGQQNQQVQAKQQEIPKRKESQKKQEQEQIQQQKNHQEHQQKQQNILEHSNRQEQQQPQQLLQNSKDLSKFQERKKSQEQTKMLEKEKSEEQLKLQAQIKQQEQNHQQEQIKPQQQRKQSEQKKQQEQQVLVQSQKQTNEQLKESQNQEQKSIKNESQKQQSSNPTLDNKKAIETLYNILQSQEQKKNEQIKLNNSQKEQIISSDQNQSQKQENKIDTEDQSQKIQKEDQQIKQVEQPIIQKIEDSVNLNENNQSLTNSIQNQNIEGYDIKKRVSINKIEELQKNMKKLQDLERSKVNKQKLDSSISSSSSIPIGGEMASKVMSPPLIDDPKNSQNIQQNFQSYNQNDNIKEQNTQVNPLQKINESINNQNNLYASEEFDKIKKIRKNSQNQQNNDTQQQNYVPQNINSNEQNTQNSYQQQQQIKLNNDNITEVNKNQMNQSNQQNLLKVGSDSIQTFGKNESNHHPQDYGFQININNASVDKQQKNPLVQSQQSTERTPIFHPQNNPSICSKDQGSLQFKTENSLRQQQQIPNSQNKVKNNMLGSFERKLVEENDNYTPTNYQKLAPVRQSVDKDPKIPSLMVQSYLTNNISDYEGDDDRHKQFVRGTGQIKPALIKKPLNLETKQFHDAVENNSRNNTQRQLKDLDQQINEIIQSDSDSQLYDQNQKHFKQTQQNKSNFQNKIDQEENDSDFFSDVKFDGDKMLQTKIKEKQNPETLYVEKKKENNIRFTESTFNAHGYGYESSGSGKGNSPSKRYSKNAKTSQQSSKEKPKQQHTNIDQDIDHDDDGDSFMDVKLQINQLDSPPIKPAIIMDKGFDYNSLNNQKNSIKNVSENNKADNLSKSSQKNNSYGSYSTQKNRIDNENQLLQSSTGAYQKQKDLQYQNYAPQEYDDDLQHEYIQTREKKSDTFNHLDIKNPLLESTVSHHEYQLQQQQLGYAQQKDPYHLGDQIIQEEQGSEVNSHTNNNSDVCSSPYATEFLQQSEKMRLSKYQDNVLEQYNLPHDQQFSLDKKQNKKVQMKIEQPNIQQNQIPNQFKIKSPNKYNTISPKIQNSSQSNQSDEDNSYTQQYYTHQDYVNIQQFNDQDTSLEEKERRLYNDLKKNLVSESKGNFTNIKMNSKGVITFETTLQKTKKFKNKDDQQVLNLNDLSVKHFKNNGSPLVFQLDLSKKTSPTKNILSDKKNQFCSPTSTYHSRAFSATKPGVNLSNNIFNKDLASSIESQEHGEFLTNNSANDVGVFYTSYEFVNTKNMNNMEDCPYNIHDLKYTHIRGQKSPNRAFNKRTKELITLNIDFDGQDIEVKVYSDDTAFSVAERMCNIIQKVITREQMRNLAAIIQKRINEYTLQLEQVVHDIETKKLKEKDVLDRFILERNVRESISNPIQKNKTLYSNEKQHDEIIGKLTIDLSHTNKKQGIIKIREKDDPYELAFSFINTFNIKKNKVSFLVEKILEIQNEYKAKQTMKLQMTYEQSSNTMNEIQYMPFREVQGYYSAEQLSKLSPQKISSPLNKTSSPIHLNQVQFKGSGELFRVNIDKGNGDYIKIVVKEGDNLKQVAYQVATDNQLNSNAYQKILKTLESAYK